jgi:putative transposase
MVTIEWLCRYFEKSRAAFYQIQKRQVSAGVDEELVIHYVKEHRKEQARIGGRKLHFLLQYPLKASGIKCGRDKLFGILAKHNLLIKRKRRSRCFTQSVSWSRRYPNLLKDLRLERPEQLWAADTTGIAVCDGLAYLALITDAYSKQIMGYNLQRTKGQSGSLATLRMALSKRWYPDSETIHHSDGGSEYFNYAYLGVLANARFKVSCTAPASPQENPVAERINGILKEEFLLNAEKRTYQDLIRVLPQAIKIYNEKRPHASCDYMTPRQAHSCSGPLHRRWKTYYRSNTRDAMPTHIGQQIQQIMHRLSTKMTGN